MISHSTLYCCCWITCLQGRCSFVLCFELNESGEKPVVYSTGVSLVYPILVFSCLPYYAARFQGMLPQVVELLRLFWSTYSDCFCSISGFQRNFVTFDAMKFERSNVHNIRHLCRQVSGGSLLQGPEDGRFCLIGHLLARRPKASCY